ncbi:MAG: phosphoglucosamine mutase, partial [Candidatus Subteraquimicrobiales bacterium]|nr:phosphoglucosamine mutase [Candidatus Subteraquimicrobiales bacterium]
CANGAAYQTSPTILRELGAKVLTFAVSPDGLNINQDCGSTYPQFIQALVKSHGVDIGFAHDGDADRVIAVDESGEEVDGDFIMAICASHLKEKKALPKDSIVTTIMTNLGFHITMKEQGINVIETKVGDRYVLEEMVSRGIGLGGEQSGHIIFLDHSTTGDGIVTILQLMVVLRDTDKKLSDLKKIMRQLPQVLINVKVKDKAALNKAKRVLETVSLQEELLKGKGRILVRPSGTEPLVRVMVEAESEEKANSIANEIVAVVKKELT